ncbi:protein fuzzy homolog isoform X2 [Venturia canescens]|nr:protein fuzzy homolog isoform X2 [Venturia canescens]
MTFSKVASLNGVHMFLKSQNIDLQDTETPDTSIVWKEFANCITLIVVASGTSKYILERFLEAVFSAMVLVAGMDEIKNLRNVERLKRDLRICNPIIDKLLECMDIGDRNSSKTDFIDMTSCIMSPENYLLQSCLEMFMECLDSMYGCVIIHGCTAVATESWWDLDPIERKLLVMAVTSDTQSSALDLPVFLPNRSPNVAFRLVSITLVNGVEVLGLCGPSPELTEVERLAVQCWRSHIEVLRTAEEAYPRNIPAGIIPDSGILAFLLVNYKLGKFVISRNSQQSKIRIAASHRLDILRTFYYQAVENFLIPRQSGNIEEEESMKNEGKSFGGGRETYWCSEYHKCHALKENDYVMCTLYTSVVPTHTMRFITQKTLKTLLADKQVCW